MTDHIFNHVVENYPLSISQLERLHGGEGCNYRITDVLDNKYILKVYAIAAVERVTFVTTILNFLEQANLPIRFPRPVKSIQGWDYTLQPDKVLVVLHWIAGTTRTRATPQMAKELGEMVGVLDKQLDKFYRTHDWDYGQYEDSLWSITNIHQLDADLQVIHRQLGGIYGLIKDSIAHFDAVSLSLQHTLSMSLIHNDINLGNLLYDPQLNLKGIIDFTEVSYTYRVCEVGVALAYLMQASGCDYWQTGQRFVQGYEQGYDFTRDEKFILLLVIKLRLSITIIYNTMQLYLGGALTASRARFIRDAIELLTKLSVTTADEFSERLFLRG